MTMTTSDSPTPGHVVIVGDGVAGLEALLALQALAGDRLDLTLVSQHDWFVDRPVTVAEPFGLGSAARHSVPDIVAERGARFVGATVVAVQADAHRVSCADGTELRYDTLILAPGARLSAPVADAIAFGLEGSGRAIGKMLDRLRSGEARSAAFVAARTTGWLLPLYELALMTARELARSKVEGVELQLLSPEDRPLALFGDQASQSAGRLLAAAGIEFVGSTDVTVQSATADCVVTLPLLRGPELAGIPTTPPDGFIAVDEFGQVTGVADVYAAGDAVNFPVKQGGLAAQQADAVAEHIAARYGAHVDPAPFRPVLRGMLFTGEDPLYMRSDVPGADPHIGGAWYPLWWPPTKIAGRHLAPYLFERDEDEFLGKPPAGFVDVDIPLAAITLPG
jgi:sulfide:quinone oxidoreductase